ncbi:MAG: 7-cyano-7-deazaguanine synthase [Acidobacteria bacterium]|nr:7-cyano-7-deazaguanine synthase [Acidobacteriota bacterium]
MGTGDNSTAVLLSAGLDSAVLAAVEAQRRRVHPIYVSTGLAWENGELAALDRLLAVPPFAGRVESLARLSFTVEDLYPETHWARRGEAPAFDTPDEDVYLAGRNIILLSKASIYCAGHKIERIALGPLSGNPFPDATPRFFSTMGTALSLGLAYPLRIDAPFSTMQKSEVILLGLELGVPLELTLSCMNPQGVLHCGQCSKCRERRDAFLEARVEDPTEYAAPPAR